MTKKFCLVLVVLCIFSKQASANVLINEILPDPTGKDSEGEWIELYNNSGASINLGGWILGDKVGQGRTFVFPDRTEVGHFDFLVCPISQTKLSLNNTGDIIELLDANGALQDKVEYPTAKPGQSYSRIDNGWLWSEAPTPNKNNIIKQPEKKAATSTYQQTKLPNIPIASAPGNQNKATTLFLALITALLSAILVLFVKVKGK